MMYRRGGLYLVTMNSKIRKYFEISGGEKLNFVTFIEKKFSKKKGKNYYY